MEYQLLFNEVKSKKVNHIKMINGEKLRLFISDMDRLCYFKKGSSRRGYPITSEMLENIKTVSYNVPKDINDVNIKQWKIINKYRKYAEKAEGIYYGDCCKAEIPKTYEEWVEQGCKSLYEMDGLTTGNGLEGKVITIEGISKTYKFLAEEVSDAIKNKKEYKSIRHRFRGYDLSIHIEPTEQGLKGYLNMEYIGTGNGYYYLLINEDCFIGYDID